ncbi:hypothetical protein PS870_06250 [Pseudomonas fluorescens]|uniref:Uncharacterized protein n=3 Tax=Pseudomonas fluorescens TaxID=294 RepID=A0A5E7QGH7_PSEFL|nr:hypothetical protein PS870_06250 [Pseudomonas fluorescens]
MLSKKSQQLGRGDDPTATFTAPDSGDVYWSQVVTLTVTLDNMPAPFAEGDYVEFELDPLADIGFPKGIKAVNPDQGNGRIFIPSTDIDGTNNTTTVSIEVYVGGLSGENVKLGANFIPIAGDSVPVTGVPNLLVLAASPGDTAITGDMFLVANPGSAPFVPTETPLNYFHVTYTPISEDTDELITDRVFVAHLSLQQSTTDGIGSPIDGALGKLVIYDNKDGTVHTPSNSLVPGTTQLIKSNAQGLFDLYICAGSTEVFGDVHLDLVGSEDLSAGTLVVNKLARPDSGVRAPHLPSSLVDASTEATVIGYIPDVSSGYSRGTQFVVVGSHVDNDKKISTYLTTLYYHDRSSWASSDSRFEVPITMFKKPEAPGTKGDAVRNEVSYIVLQSENRMNQSSAEIMEVWRSDTTIAPDVPPAGNPNIDAPTFIGSTKPNEVDPSMCLQGLQVRLDLSQQTNLQPGMEVTAKIILSGWAANGHPIPKQGVATCTVTLTDSQIRDGYVVARFMPSDTAGYRDDQATGHLGNITAFYWVGAQPHPDLTSQSVKNKFYSSGIGSRN